MPNREKVKVDLLSIKTYLNSQAIEAKDKIVREAFMESARDIDDALALLEEQKSEIELKDKLIRELQNLISIGTKMMNGNEA